MSATDEQFEPVTANQILLLLRAAAGEVGIPSRDGFYEMMSRKSPAEIIGWVNGSVLGEVEADVVLGLEHAPAAMATIAEINDQHLGMVTDFLNLKSMLEDDENAGMALGVQKTAAAVLDRHIVLTRGPRQDLWAVAKTPVLYRDRPPRHSAPRSAPSEDVLLAAMQNILTLLERYAAGPLDSNLTKGMTLQCIFGSAKVAPAAEHVLDKMIEHQNGATVIAMSAVVELSKLERWARHDLKSDDVIRPQGRVMDLIAKLHANNNGLAHNGVVVAERAIEGQWDPLVRAKAMQFVKNVIDVEGKKSGRRGSDSPNIAAVQAIARLAVARVDEPGTDDLRTQIAAAFPLFRQVVDPGFALRAMTARLDGKKLS